MEELFIHTGVNVEDGEPRFLLKNLVVFNWGPFSGLQAPAEIDPRGSAIIGATGSGKTTLVDALMTLLVARPRYNYASTGGHDNNDRSEVSYVRGVRGTLGSGGDESNVMRSGKTVTGITACYTDGKKMYKLGAILWFDNHSQATSDLKRIWFIINNHEDELTDMLKMFDEGGKPAIKRYAKSNHHLEVFDNKKGYLAMIRRFFEVGDNAFDLLNRAAGLKQLNSIDQIFRELVLDNKPQFDRAIKVAKSFDDLEAIYQELLQARRQVESLQPIAKEKIKWDKLRTQLEQFKSFRELIPKWFALQAGKLWKQQLAEDEEKLNQVQTRHQDVESREASLSEQAKALQTLYMEQGGAAIEGDRNAIESQKQLLKITESTLAKYHQLCAKSDLSEIYNSEQFSQNVAQIESIKAEQEKAKENTQEALYTLKSTYGQLADRRNTVLQDIASVEKRKSNIPTRYQEFREDLAKELNTDAESLPFIAEMIEVKPEQKEWRGAIERAIGMERLRIVVPQKFFHDAKKWVNHRNNKLNVRLLDTGKIAHMRAPFDDSFIHKLNLEQGGDYAEALMQTLVGRDRHCVTIENLDNQEHSMTAEGGMYDRAGRFEKMDQKPLHKDWWTGFDNSYALQELKEELLEIDAQLEPSLEDEGRLKQRLKNIEENLFDIRNLGEYEFDQIDVFSMRERLAELEQRLAMLEDPDSDLAKSLRDYKQVEEELKRIKKELSEVNQALGAARDRVKDSRWKLNQINSTIGSGIPDGLRELLEKNLKLPSDLSLPSIKRRESEAQANLNGKIDKLEEKNNLSTNRLKGYMEKALQVDNGALLEVGTDLIDIDEYLKRLSYLQDEDLPQRQKEFLDYLNQSSEQGVTQLLRKIKNEVSQIQDRLELLNATLGKVEYKKGKFLMLEAAEVSSDSLRQVTMAEKKVNATRLQDDETGALRYNALKSLVSIIREAANNKRTIASLSLLDPRYRLEFYVREVDRETLRKSDKLVGSQSASGGEKEQMASYILTASLSYALSPKGSLRPKYATIVLDEAFSKSSPSAATKIIQALREFGLHPLFVTPNKELSLLKANTSSAILVHQATLTSLSWKELDEKRRSEMKKKK